MARETDTAREHDELVVEARRRLERMASRLCDAIGIDDTAMSLLGTGMALLTAAHGREKAAAVLAGCAEEVADDADDDTPIAGHA